MESQLNISHKGAHPAHYACKEVYELGRDTCCVCAKHKCDAPYRYVNLPRRRAMFKKNCKGCYGKGYYTKATGDNVVMGDFEGDVPYIIPLKIEKIKCKKCNILKK